MPSPTRVVARLPVERKTSAFVLGSPVRRNRPAGVDMLALERFERDPDRLWFQVSVDGSPFSLSIWYEGLDLRDLERRFGDAAMRRVYFHIAAFNLNQFVSLAPARIDFGPFAAEADPAFESFWRSLVHGAWAQWRWENDLPRYAGPDFAVISGVTEPIVYPRSGKALLFSGGGKDSVVAQSLLSSTGLRYDALTYSRSVYGPRKTQHDLIEKAVRFGNHEAHRRIDFLDDFLESPVLQRTEYDLSTVTSAETPAAIFASLPLVLASGYDAVVAANERSADVDNFVWSATGEGVNHQWGKSLEAETLFSSYIEERLLAGFRYYSVLKPFSDVAIFNLGASELPALRYAHSCNERKPWCERCAKCAYVWLNYRAYYPASFVEGIFTSNLLDVPENRRWFRDLLGLEGRSAMECVGQPAETRLAFELARRAGLRGAAMSDFVALGRGENYREVLETYLATDADGSGHMPAGVWRAVAAEADGRIARRRPELLERLRGD